MLDESSSATPPGTAFVVWVDDNFNHGDENERRRKGSYGTYEEALKVCREIVDQDLHSQFRAGMTAGDLGKIYRSFGSDPWISGNPAQGQPPFSAWAYATERAAEMCKPET